MTAIAAPVGNEDAGRADEDVLAWRELRFLEEGAPAELAQHLARSPIDLHEFERLRKAGCAPELAARILG